MGLDWNNGLYEFSCPTCSSRFFRTVTFGPPMVRECRGRLVSDPSRPPSSYSGCTFSWPSTDDELYFSMKEPYSEDHVWVAEASGR